jgi:predicted Rossmann fold nucleotide-binding protein DprA/Smf involved in DNA uptake
MTDRVSIPSTDPKYPPQFRKHLGDHAPTCIFTLGKLEILQTQPLALFCSRKCPGDLILKTYDLAQHWRAQGVTVIGGFHSPMERECLRILLRSPHPVILCPARGLPRRIEPEFKRPLAEGRLLLLSALPDSVRHATEDTARQRNCVVAALADRIFIAFAELSSKTESFCRAIVTWGKPLLTHSSPATANLIALGAKPVGATEKVSAPVICNFAVVVTGREAV